MAKFVPGHGIELDDGNNIKEYIQKEILEREDLNDVESIVIVLATDSTVEWHRRGPVSSHLIGGIEVAKADILKAALDEVEDLGESPDGEEEEE